MPTRITNAFHFFFYYAQSCIIIHNLVLSLCIKEWSYFHTLDSQQCFHTNELTVLYEFHFTICPCVSWNRFTLDHLICTLFNAHTITHTTIHTTIHTNNCFRTLVLHFEDWKCLFLKRWEWNVVYLHSIFSHRTKVHWPDIRGKNA